MHWSVICMRKYYDLLVPVTVMVGYIETKYGRDSPVVAFIMDVGLGMISNSIQISNTNDLEHALKLIDEKWDPLSDSTVCGTPWLKKNVLKNPPRPYTHRWFLTEPLGLVSSSGKRWSKCTYTLWWFWSTDRGCIVRFIPMGLRCRECNHFISFTFQQDPVTRTLFAF